MDAPRAPIGPVSGKAKVVEALIGGLFAGGLIALLGLVALTPSRSAPTDPLTAIGQSRVALSSVNGAGGREAVARNGHAPTRHGAAPEEARWASMSGRRRARGHDGAVTNWGYLLIAVYVGLGLSDVPRVKAIALAAVVTAIAIAYALVRIGSGAY